MNFKEFTLALQGYAAGEIIFVGLGNEYRRDDRAGLMLSDGLKRTPDFSGCHFINAGTNPENYLQDILSQHAKVVVFIDAARFGGAPGEIQWLDDDKIDNVKISTHAYSIKMVETYLKAHQNLQVKYLGIEPHDTDPGEKFSPVVHASLTRFFKSE